MEHFGKSTKIHTVYIAADPYNNLKADLQIMIDSFQGTRPIIMAGLFAEGMRKIVCSLKQSLLPEQSNAYSGMSQDPTAVIAAVVNLQHQNN